MNLMMMLKQFPTETSSKTINNNNRQKNGWLFNLTVSSSTHTKHRTNNNICSIKDSTSIMFNVIFHRLLRQVAVI